MKLRNLIITLGFGLTLVISGCDLFYTNGNPTPPGPVDFNLIYDGNGNDGGSVPIDPTIYHAGEVAPIPTNTGLLTKAGFNFVGWNTSPDGTGTHFTANQTLTFVASNVNLYAKWTSNPVFSVTYAGNGNASGTVPVDNTKYEVGATVTLAKNPNNLAKTDGNVLVGWNDGTTTLAIGTTYTAGSAPMTFTATWGAKNFAMTFQFKNFPVAADASVGACYLAGGFTIDGWGGMTSYPVTFTSGTSDVITVPGQNDDTKILFRLSTTGWSYPTGYDPVVLEPNAWDALVDDHSYSSSEPSWGIGPGNGETDGTGVAYPAIPWNINVTHSIVIDGKNGTGRAKLILDGVTYWGN